jgi:hypothetical protein
MELGDFAFTSLPHIATPRALSGASPLGLLQDLKGTWVGIGFNVIWRPNRVKGAPNVDHFLELNLTHEILQFDEIPGPIPNRSLLQRDIKMFGLWYLQKIEDRIVTDPTTGKPAGLHIEPGIWATVEPTQHPNVGPTVVRMASIPHGTTVLAQGTATSIPMRPDIPEVSITPFLIGNLARPQSFDESDLSKGSTLRTPDADKNFTQAMLDNPNSVLLAALDGKNVINTVVLDVSSSSTNPAPGGGTANTAFLQGSPDEGPNATTEGVSATFWIETIQGAAGAPDVQQLQYTQTVLLNFNGLSWPHVTVATLQKVPTSGQEALPRPLSVRDI